MGHSSSWDYCRLFGCIVTATMQRFSFLFSRSCWEMITSAVFWGRNPIPSLGWLGPKAMDESPMHDGAVLRNAGAIFCRDLKIRLTVRSKVRQRCNTNVYVCLFFIMWRTGHPANNVSAETGSSPLWPGWTDATVSHLKMHSFNCQSKAKGVFLKDNAVQST